MVRKKRDSDFAITAYRVVEQVIKNTETAKIGTSLDQADIVLIDGKNPHAVALGKLGGSKGGKIRAERLTPEQRKEIAQKAARKRWEKK